MIPPRFNLQQQYRNKSSVTARIADRGDKANLIINRRYIGLKHVEYTERLQRLNLHSLELRRLRTDLIWCYKIVFGLVCLNFGDFLKFCPVSTTRGHPCKLYTSHCTRIRSRFFCLSRNKSVEQSTAVYELLVTSCI